MKRITAATLLLLSLLIVVTGTGKASPMAQTKTIPEREYTPGTYEVELNTLPGNSAGAEFIFTRPAGLPGTPETILAQVDVYFSRDNGATWAHLMGGGFPGGVLYNKDGTVATTSNMLITWPGEAGPNGRVALKGSDVKVVATVYQTFRTSITVNSITSTGK